MTRDEIHKTLVEDGPAPPAPFGEIKAILESAGCVMFGNEGNAASFKHYLHPDIVTIRDLGQKPMHSGDVRRVGRYLRELISRGG